jgi:hypothetical protein
MFMIVRTFYCPNKCIVKRDPELIFSPSKCQIVYGGKAGVKKDLRNIRNQLVKLKNSLADTGSHFLRIHIKLFELNFRYFLNLTFVTFSFGFHKMFTEQWEQEIQPHCYKDYFTMFQLSSAISTASC